MSADTKGYLITAALVVAGLMVYNIFFVETTAKLKTKMKP